VTQGTRPGAGAATAAPALEVQDLSLKIGGATILEDISFAVPAGEIVGVIGPNGAGKTTLFNLVSGVHQPTSGKVLLSGRDVTSRSITQRAVAGLGRTFQTSSVFPGLTVQENVRLAAQVDEGSAISLFRFPRATDAATGRARELLHVLVGHGDRRVPLERLLAGQ